jgi:hypothetical protein
MSSKQFDQLPVVTADGKLLGMINQKAVIRAYVDYYFENNLT